MSTSKNRAEAVIALIGEDGLSELTKRVEKDLADIAKRGGDASDSTESLFEYLKGAAEEAKEVAKGVAKVGVAVAGAALAAKGLAENVRMAAQSEAVERQFEAITRSAGGAAAAMSQLTQATAGGIDGTTLQQYAIQAKDAGVSIEQLSSLLEAANRAATATGQSQTEVSEKYVQAIADMSDGVFKASGLQVDMGQVVAQTTQKLGISSDALSVNERRQLLLAKALEQTNIAYGDVRIDERIAAVNRLDAEIANLTDNTSRWAAVQTIKVAEAFGVYESAATKTARLSKEIDWLSERIEQGVTPAVVQNTGSILQGTKTIVTHADAVAETRRRQIRWEEDIKELTATLLSDREALDIWITGLSESTQVQQILEGNVVRSTDAYRAFIDQVKFGADTTTEEGRRQRALASSIWDQADALGQLLVLRAEEQRIMAKAEADRFEREKRVSEEMRRNAINNARRAAAEAERLARLQDEAAERATARRAQQLASRSKGSKSKAEQPKFTQDQLNTEDYYDALADAEKRIQEAQAAAAKAAEKEREERLKEADRHADLVLRTLERQQEAMVATGHASRNMAQTMLSSFGGVGASVANASDIIVSQTTQIVAAMDEFKKAGLDSSDAFVASVPGMLSASGQLVAGFIGDKQAQAGVMGAFELAAAIGSFAQYDYVGGAMHLLSSGMYFAVAGGAGASGGASVGAGGAPPSPPQLNQRLPQIHPNTAERTSDGGSVHIHLTGATIIGSDEQRAGRDLLNMIERARGRRSRPNPQFIPV